MSDNHTRQKAIRSALNNLYPKQPKGNTARSLNILGSIISGIVGSKSTNLPQIASKTPDTTLPDSREKKYSRWLKDENVTAELFFIPFILQLLSSFTELVLAMDGSTVGRGCITLMISLIYKGRALPIAWIVVKGKKGHLPEDLHIELIEKVKDLIPSDTDVVFLGDGEFDGIRLLAVITELGWKYACRTAKSSKYYVQGEELQIGCDLGGELEPGKIIDVSEALFTKKLYGPVMIVAWWDKKYKEPIYLVSNMELSKSACDYYRKRYKIETFFSDQKSRGFNLHKSHISDPTRISRLMIAACLAYIWIIYLGTYAMANNWNKIIHRKKRCDLSLFQMGLRLLEHFLNEGMTILVKFQIIWVDN